MARRTAQADVEETATEETAPVAEQPETVAEAAAEPVETESKETEAEKEARKPLAPLDFSAIHISRTVSAEAAAKFRHTMSGRTREPDQLAADDLVSKAHAQWVAADRPKDWADAMEKAGMHFRVREDQLAPLKARIQRAGAFHGVAIRFGKVLPSETHEGHVETLFYAKDKPAKDASEVDEGAETE